MKTDELIKIISDPKSSVIEQVQAEIALRTAIEALAKDAERYRWLKEHCVLGIYQNGNGWDMGIDGVAPDSKRDIDSAVDAAMKE